jgi:hypothetical protein
VGDGANAGAIQSVADDHAPGGFGDFDAACVVFDKSWHRLRGSSRDVISLRVEVGSSHVAKERDLTLELGFRIILLQLLH